MAYLQPASLTCSHCGFRSEITWVIGVGPNMTPGKAPYRKLHTPGAFQRDPLKRNALICPECDKVAL